MALPEYGKNSDREEEEAENLEICVPIFMNCS
jgi:hypothetical protein